MFKNILTEEPSNVKKDTKQMQRAHKETKCEMERGEMERDYDYAKHENTGPTVFKLCFDFSEV